MSSAETLLEACTRQRKRRWRSADGSMWMLQRWLMVEHETRSRRPHRNLHLIQPSKTSRCQGSSTRTNQVSQLSSIIFRTKISHVRSLVLSDIALLDRSAASRVVETLCLMVTLTLIAFFRVRRPSGGDAPQSAPKVDSDGQHAYRPETAAAKSMDARPEEDTQKTADRRDVTVIPGLDLVSPAAPRSETYSDMSDGDDDDDGGATPTQDESDRPNQGTFLLVVFCSIQITFGRSIWPLDRGFEVV